MAATYRGDFHDVEGREAPHAARCHKCNSAKLTRVYHRDLVDCISMHQGNSRASQQWCGGEHLHWWCRDCGHDFCSPCAGEHDE